MTACYFSNCKIILITWIHISKHKIQSKFHCYQLSSDLSIGWYFNNMFFPCIPPDGESESLTNENHKESASVFFDREVKNKSL